MYLYIDTFYCNWGKLICISYRNGALKKSWENNNLYLKSGASMNLFSDALTDHNKVGFFSVEAFVIWFVTFDLLITDWLH